MFFFGKEKKGDDGGCELVGSGEGRKTHGDLRARCSCRRGRERGDVISCGLRGRERERQGRRAEGKGGEMKRERKMSFDRTNPRTSPSSTRSPTRFSVISVIV